MPKKLPLDLAALVAESRRLKAQASRLLVQAKTLDSKIERALQPAKKRKPK